MVKGPKDPNAPKKPASPFLQWRGKNYHSIVKTMPVGYSFGELAKKLSSVWKNVSAEEKAPLEATYKTALAKYHKLMSAYKHTASYKAFQKTKATFKLQNVKKSKFRKDENAPKKPLSGYFLFLEANREKTKTENPNASHKDQLKLMGAAWAKLSEAGKKVFNDKAATAKKKYQVELEKYKQTAQYKAYMEEKNEWSATKKTKLSKAKASKDGSPKKAKKAKKVKKAKSPTSKKPKAPKAKSSRKAARKSARKSARKASKSKKAKRSSK